MMLKRSEILRYNKILEGVITGKIKVDPDDQAEISKMRTKVANYYAHHPRYFLEDFVQIIHGVTNDTIPFKLNDGQKMVEKSYLNNTKIVVPKSRQMGLTTLTNGLALHHGIFQTNASIIILATKAANAEKNLKQIKRMYASMPAWAKEFFIEFADHTDNQSMWSFKSEITQTETTYECFSANSPDSIRGKTATMCHWTETSFCDYAREVFTSLRPVLERRGDSRIVVESTSNGQGNFFYDICMKNLKGWDIVFLPWYLDKGYTENVQLSEAQKAESWEAIEEDLDLTEGQVAWYYRQVQEAGLKATHQEYPTTLEQSFRATSESFFSNNVIDKIDITAPLVGSYEWRNRALLPASEGHCKVFEAPRPEYNYLLSCDPSGGSQDAAAIIVMNPDGEQVFEFNDKLDIEELSQLVYAVARMYNDALCVIERNGIGSFVVHTLIHRLFYQNIYHDKNQAGIQTSNTTKEYGCSQLSKMIDDGTLTFRSQALREEMITFDRTTLRAFMDCTDDMVLCASFIAYVWRIMPPLKKRIYIEERFETIGMNQGKPKRNFHRY